MRPIGKDGRRLLANLLYSDAKCMDVFVEGRSIRRNGVTLTLDEGEIGRQLEDSAVEYYRDI